MTPLDRQSFAASPYRVFEAHPRSIRRAVMFNLLGPGALPHALDPSCLELKMNRTSRSLTWRPVILAGLCALMRQEKLLKREEGITGQIQGVPLLKISSSRLRRVPSFGLCVAPSRWCPSAPWTSNRLGYTVGARRKHGSTAEGNSKPPQ